MNTASPDEVFGFNISLILYREGMNPTILSPVMGKLWGRQSSLTLERQMV